MNTISFTRLTTRAFALFLLLLPATVLAQYPSGKLYVLNEGAIGTFGSLGYVGFPGGHYHEIDTVPVFGRDMLKSGDTLYVIDGNGDLLVYDLPTETRVNEINGLGAQTMALYGDELLLAGTSHPYFRALDVPGGYTQSWSLDSNKIRSGATGLHLNGDIAYLSVGFGSVDPDSQLVRVDLQTQDTTHTRLIARNPGGILQFGDTLYVQCLTDFSNPVPGAVISVLNAADLSVIRLDTLGILSFGGFEPGNNGDIYLSDNTTFGSESIVSYNRATGTLGSTVLSGNYRYYINSLAANGLFVSETDFFSFGQVRFAQGGALSSPAELPISPFRMIFEPGDPLIDLGPDQSYCDSVSLQASLDNLPGISVLWSDGNTDPIRSFSSDTTLSVVVTDGFGNSDSDTVAVEVITSPLLGGPYAVGGCEGEQLLLDATALVNQSADAYYWNFGTVGNTFLYTPDSSANDTLFLVKENEGLCTTTDSVFVNVAARPDDLFPTYAVLVGNDLGNNLLRANANDSIEVELTSAAPVSPDSISWNLSRTGAGSLNNFTGTTTTNQLTLGMGLPFADSLMAMVTASDAGCAFQDTLYLQLVDFTGRQAPFSARLSIYPNPFGEEVRVETGQPLEQIRLLNLQGQVVRQVSLNGKEDARLRNLSSLPAGVYLVQVTATTGEEITRRLVKR